MQTALLITNVALFQTGWLACVLGAASGRPWAGPIAATVILPVHLLSRSNRGGEALLLMKAALVGVVVDGSLAALGVIDYAGWGPADTLPPPWLISLWLIFATTLNHSLSWLKGRPAPAAVLGAAGGAASYLLGARLGAIGVDASVASLTVLATTWGMAMVLLTRLSGGSRTG